MICTQCDGTGFVEEPAEFRMKCEVCQDGVAICLKCGDFATRTNTEGEHECDPCHYVWEREAAA